MEITPNDVEHMSEYLYELIDDTETYVKNISKEVEEQRQHLLRLLYDLEMETKKLESLRADLEAITPSTEEDVIEETDLVCEDEDDDYELEICDEDCGNCPDYENGKCNAGFDIG